MTLPAIDSLNTYGGPLSDYRPPPDPTVERSKVYENQAFASIAMATNTLTRAWAKVTLGTSPTIVSHNAVWGNASGVAPVITHTATGTYSITWPQTVTDALGVVQPINLGHGWASIETAAPVFLSVSRASAYVLTLSTFSSSGSAADLAEDVVHVFVI